MSETKSLPVLIKEATGIVQFLLENDGELPPEMELAHELNTAAMAEKADQYGFVLAELEARAEFLKNRVDAYREAIASIEKGTSNIEQRLKWAMTELQLKEIAGSETRFVLMQNPPKVSIDDEKKIPGTYFVSEVKTSLDKKKLLEDLKAGQEVAGARIERGIRVARKINTKASKAVSA